MITFVRLLGKWADPCGTAKKARLSNESSVATQLTIGKILNFHWYRRGHIITWFSYQARPITKVIYLLSNVKCWCMVKGLWAFQLKFFKEDFQEQFVIVLQYRKELAHSPLHFYKANSWNQLKVSSQKAEKQWNEIPMKSCAVHQWFLESPDISFATSLKLCLKPRPRDFTPVGIIPLTMLIIEFWT